MIAQEIFNKKWFDQYGNLKPNSWDETSENPSTINNVAAIMADKLGLDVRDVLPIAKLNEAKWKTNGGKYMTMENDDVKYKAELKDASCWDAIKMRLGVMRSSNRFSHDETNGVAVGSFYGMTKHMTMPTEMRKPLIEQHETNLYKIDENTKQTFYRPYDVGAATKYAKRRFRESYQGNHDHLIAQIELFAVNACKNTDKDAQGNYVTSGKQQAWLRVMGLRLPNLVMINMTEELPETGKWIEVFSNFYPERDHPINVMARALYEL